MVTRKIFISFLLREVEIITDEGVEIPVIVDEAAKELKKGECLFFGGCWKLGRQPSKVFFFKPIVLSIESAKFPDFKETILFTM